MKHLVLDNCICGSVYCSLNAYDFIFYHNLNFYMITSSSCNGFKDLEMKVGLISQFLNTKEVDNYARFNNNGRMCLDESFKEFRKRNLNLNRAVNEVNLIYSNGGNLKAICTAINYLDLANSQEQLLNNYKESESYLIENGYSHFKNELKLLYDYNFIHKGQNLEIETVKTIDKLIKTLKDEIKPKRKHNNVI